MQLIISRILKIILPLQKNAMSKIDKLIIRLLSYPKDFTYNELKKVMSSFGYSEVQGSGSRVCFSKDSHKIKLHKPHPENKLKTYQLDLIIEALTNRGLISKNESDENNGCIDL
jgi:predicted RNA binding protein YcfA (HicA-like mRNA interferase family)